MDRGKGCQEFPQVSSWSKASLKLLGSLFLTEHVHNSRDTVLKRPTSAGVFFVDVRILLTMLLFDFFPGLICEPVSRGHRTQLSNQVTRRIDRGKT